MLAVRYMQKMIHAVDRLGRGSVGLLMSNSLNAALQFLMMVLISRFLGAEMTGNYSLAQSYIIPATFLASLAFRQQILMNTEDTYSLDDFLATRWGFASIVLFASVVVIQVFEAKLVVMIGLGLAVVKIFEGFADIAANTLQKHNKIMQISILAITRFIFSFLTIFLLLVYTHDILYALLGLAIVFILHYVLFEHPASRKAALGEKMPKEGKLKRRMALVYTGIPLATGLMLGAFHLSAARILLERFHGVVELGHFSAVFQLIMIANIVVGAMYNSLLTPMTKAFKNKDKATYAQLFTLTCSAIAAVVFVGVILSHFLGDFIITLIYGDAFSGLGNLLMMAVATSVFFFCNGFIVTASMACGIVGKQVWISAAGLIGVLICGLLTVPQYGSIGALASIAIGSIIQMLLLIGAILIRWKHHGV